ncbi:MAG: hypothetical protein EBR82_87955 [Caulobacteraceae bacterium]|nr:hypothetical protein [Caulobacteraceae bacterium]
MKNTQKNALAQRLAYHVTGAIERGQAVAIIEQPANLLTFDEMIEIDDARAEARAESEWTLGDE